MKHYPKTYKNLSSDLSPGIIAHTGSTLGSVVNLANNFKLFYKKAYDDLFEMIVKYVWLEQHFSYNGVRRVKRCRNGHAHDRAFSFFMNGIVGINQKPVTTSQVYSAVPSYLNDFFLDFLEHDPFKEPEYFKFPYKNITLDFLLYVYQCDDRLELLKEADERGMKSKEFIDWATNYVLCYNDDVGKDVYKINRHSFCPYIKKI